MGKKQNLIYCVEDEESIRGLVSYVLTGQNFEVAAFENSQAFWKAIEVRQPQLILLDIMLEGEDGLHILRGLRQREKYRHIPVIMVTAKTTEFDIVKGLDAGADDYINKPFGVVELVSRIKAVLRRTAQPAKEECLSSGDLTVDKARHLVTWKEQEINLTLKEYELLVYFMENKGLALSREKIMEAVWGFLYEGESRTVDMHVMTLRQQLGKAGQYIKTVRGVGYRWAQEE